MGNSVAKVSINLDQHHFGEQDDNGWPILVAGDTVSGKVTIDLSDSDLLTQVHDYQLQLRVNGKEKVQIKEGYKVRRAERVLLTVNTVLHDFSVEADSSDVIPGYHDFPFEFDLPTHIPASMSYSSAGGSSCQIRYKITAVLDRVKKKPVLLTRISKVSSTSRCRQSMAHSLDFVVQSKPRRPEIVPWSMEPTTREIKSLGVVKKGGISFGARVDDTHVNKGDDVNISVACRNNSSAEIESFDMTLFQTFTLKSGRSGRERVLIEVLQQAHDTDITEAIKTPEEVFFARNVIATDKHTMHQEICIELHNNPQHQLSLQVPKSAFDSYSGQLIKCSHSLEIKVKTVTMVDDPVVLVPLMILKYSNDGVDDSESDDYADSDSDCHIDSTRAVVPVHLDSIEESATVEDDDGDEPRLLQRKPTISKPIVRIPSSSVISGGDQIVEMEQSVESFGTGSNTSISSSQSSMQSENSFFNQDDEIEADVEEVKEDKPPSYEDLVTEMLGSLDDLNIIISKSEMPEWRDIFSSLTDEQYGNLIACVNLDFDQPKVAARLASHLCQESSFTCQYAAAALQNTAEWNRVAMIQRLLPFCSDLKENRPVITEKLTPWELIVVAPDFENAINAL